MVFRLWLKDVSLFFHGQAEGLFMFGMKSRVKLCKVLLRLRQVVAGETV